MSPARNTKDHHDPGWIRDSRWSPATSNRETKGSLALRVLRRLAGALEANLLALLHAGVTRQHAGALQRRAKLLVEAGQGTGDAVADRADLAGDTATHNRGDDIELLSGRRGAKRRHQQGLVQAATTEVLGCRLAIHCHLTRSRVQANARDRRLAAADAVVVLALVGLR